MSCSVAFSVMALICSDFISVLLCGDLVPSLGAGEPKNRESRRTEENKSKGAAGGNRRDASRRVARGCARGRFTCLVLDKGQRRADWLRNSCYGIYISETNAIT